MKKISFLILALTLTLIANAQIARYIKVTASGTGLGTSWANAAGNADIQTMIDAVAADANKGTVYFAAGTYTPTATIVIRDGVNMSGGYASDGSGTRDLLNNQTILDGATNKRIIYATDANTTAAFTKITTIDGFILQRGSSSYGSAAFITYGVVLQNCIIRNNNGSTYGSAIMAKRTLSLSSPTTGWNMSCALINCLIINNSSSNYAAGVWIDQDAHFSMINCVIANNKSTDATNGIGGLYVGPNIRYSRMTNNIFYNNSSAASSSRNNFYSATTNFAGTFSNYFSDATIPVGGVSGLGNKTSTDYASPGFVNPTSFQGYTTNSTSITEINNSNWRLSSTSPLIGLGISTSNADLPYPYSTMASFGSTNKLYSSISTDIMGSNRIISTYPEMGAYEYNPITITAATADAAMGSASGTTTVSKGTNVTLTATPTNGTYIFVNWTNGATVLSTSSTYTFATASTLTATANFLPFTSFTPTITYVRTATTIDVLVTNPTGYTGTFTYNVLDGSNNVLASAVSASAQASTLVYSATGLSANSSLTYKVVAIINGTINSQTATVAATTRKYKNSSIEVIDDFESGDLGWTGLSGGVVTSPFSNPTSSGINISANVAKVSIAIGQQNYSGLMNVKEKIQVGPTAPYKYLHLKLKRTADNGGLSLTFLARTDISQAQMQPTLIAYAATMIDGTWYDYVFDLSTVDVADKTAFGFYIRPNITAGLTTAASISYIDDIYLSNSATASSANITIPIAISAGTGGTVSQATNSYLSGDNATVVATPSTGYIFNNWTEGGNPVSSNASYTFSVSTARTLVANFLPSKTFTVTVPAGTAHVYIVGSFTLKSWDATATAYELTRVGITNQFTGTFACDNSISYKYLCENMNDYDYQAAVSAGGVSESNRSYSASDNVVAWYRMKTITLNVSFATASIPSKLFVKGGWDSWATPIELTKSGSTFNTTISGFGSKFPANTEYKYYTNDGATSNYECNSDGSGSSNRWSIYPTMTDQVARFLTAPTIQTSTNSNISDLGLTVTQLGGTDLVVASGELILDQTPVSVNSITVNPGAKLTLASGKTLTAGTLTLQSDATNGSATFVDNGGTLSATATVQQYLTGARNWYFTSPITSATSNVVTGTVGNQLWSYSEPGYNWNPITATDSTLHVGNGYVAKLAIDGTLSFTGTLNTGNQQVSLIRTENGKAKRGFNLIGNPYPSYLDPTTVINSAPEMENTVWYRIKVSSTYHFETVNTTSGIGTNNSGAGAVTKYIPPMQAFWVRVAPTYTAKSLTFTNTMRSHEAGTNRLRVKEQNTQQIVRLQVSNGISSDETVLYSDPNASGSYDPYDSQKMTNSIASIPEIYTLAGTEQLAINGLDVIPYDTEFPIGFTTGQAGTNFSIKASQFSNFETGIQILLHDYLLNTTQDLAMADYSFTSDAVATSTRFTVLFKAPSVATGINQNANANVWISLANNQILVNGVSGESTVAVYNAVGQRLVSQRLIASTKSVGTFVPGVYLVTVTNSSKSVTQKVIIK